MYLIRKSEELCNAYPEIHANVGSFKILYMLLMTKCEEL
jgi:hypothetical protein